MQISKIDISKYFSFIFIFFVFFPFLTFIKTGTDMQPYAIMIAFFLLLIFKLSLNKNQILFIILTLFSIILLLFSDINFSSFRSLYNYFSITIIYIISYNILKIKKLNHEKLINIFFFVWILVGLIQTLFYKNFLTFLISESRSTENRGVTSLSPEPSFFALILLFFLSYFLILEEKKLKRNLILITLSILFLTKSSLGILFLLILWFYYQVNNFKIKYILSALVMIICLIQLSTYFTENRVVQLLNIFIEKPSNLLLLDASVNDRFFQIFFSFKGFISSFFLPHGYSQWAQFLEFEIPKYSDYVLVEYFSVGDRIMSAYGSVFFELGIVALIIPGVILKNLYILYYKNYRKYFYYNLILINLILLSALPIGFSYIGFYIALLDFKIYQRKNVEQSFKNEYLTN